MNRALAGARLCLFDAAYPEPALGGDCIATRAVLSREVSAKGIMSLILFSAWLQRFFSLSVFFFFFHRDRLAQWDNLASQVNLA